MRRTVGKKKITRIVAHMEKNAIKPDKNGNYCWSIPKGCFIPSKKEIAKYYKKKWMDAIYRGN